MGTVVNLPKADTEDPILQYIPSTGWIGEYMKWTEQSEPPTRFRFATSLAIISCALTRNVWLPYENKGTYPNLWVLLMGPSGCGKDGAINQGYDLFMKLEKRPKVLAEKITPEALVKSLAALRPKEPQSSILSRDCRGVVFAPELSTFLGRARYNEGMITLLTRLFDCPAYLPTETIVRQNITLTDVCVCMLWGSTPDWYVRYMPEGAMCGGFMSRILYVFFNGQEKRLPNPPPFHPGHEARLLSGLGNIMGMEGPMRLDRHATEWFEGWYHTLPDPSKNGEQIAGYTSRKPITVKKIAMILSVSNSEDKIVREHHVQSAIGIVETFEKKLKLEVPKMGATSSGFLTDYMAHTIGLKPEGMQRREVMQRTYRKLEGKRDEFDRLIDWLMQMGRIEQFRSDEKIYYRVTAKGEWEDEST